MKSATAPASAWERRSPVLWLVVLLALLVTIIVAGGWRMINVQRAEARKLAEDMLTHIAALKADQISDWMAERRISVYTRLDQPQALQFLQTPQNAALRQQMQQWLDHVEASYNFASVALFDAGGTLRMQSSADNLKGSNADTQEHNQDIVQEAIKAGAVVFHDLHVQENQHLAMRFAVPIRALPLDGQPAAGALVFQIDPQQFLYPLIQRWPTISASAETLLIRREGNDVVFLNELRHRANTALKLRLPIDANTSLPAAMAALGQEGVVEGVDYRDVKVLGVVRKVKGTPWFMVAKVDQAEIFGPLQQQVRTTGLVIALVVLLASLGVALLWRQQHLINARLHAAELVQQRTLLRTLISTIPNLIWLKDVNGVYQACNTAFERFFGAAEAAIVGKTDADFVDADLAQFFRQKDLEAIAADRPLVNEEWVTFAANGQRVLLETTKVAVLGPDGQTIGVLGISHDITAQRQSQEAAAKNTQELERSRRALLSVLHDQRRAQAELLKFSLAIEQSPESIVITNTKAEIEYVNPAFLVTTGYTREQVIGQNPRVLHSGKTPRATYVAMWAALTAGQPWRGEFLNKKANGEEYAEFAVITPLRQADGNVSHYVAVKEDVTERKRVGAELDQHRHHLEDLVAQRTAELRAASAQAEAANRAKSLFLANVGHEIRTPLNAILGLTHVLQRDGVSARQNAQINQIHASGEHLLALVNDVLDLSKAESEKLSLVEADFHLSAVTDPVISMVRTSATAKGLRVDLDNSGVPEWLRGDALRLRQCLLNLAANAVKFTEHGSIQLRAIVVDADENSLLLRFEVQDTGIGISDDQMSKLFQVFQQIDASSTRRYGGTGLCLALTRKLAQLMGGEAGGQSSPGVGSTFWFTARLKRGHGFETLATQQTAAEPVEPLGAALAQPEPHSASAHQDVLLRLAALLASDDTVALDLLAAEQDALRLALGSDFDKFQRQLKAFDFPGALQLLQALPSQSRQL